jgi:PAS domain S-box-containing protein
MPACRKELFVLRRDTSVHGGRDAAALVRSHDWSRTPLGLPETWPQPLKTLVEVMLASDQPMFIAWGDERTLLYNDPYAEILATKHPSALGRPFLEVWFEIRDDLVPIVDLAFAGESVHMDDITLIMQRRGYEEETHFSFSYTPVRDEAGKVAGMFCACTETTEQVLAKRRREADAERLRRMFERAPGFICILRGPTHEVEFVNLAHRELFGSENWLGKSVRDATPELAEQGFHALLDRVYSTGERYVGSGEAVRFRRSQDGRELQIIHDFIYEPMIDEYGQIIGIFCEGFDVTETHRARETLRAHAERQGFLLRLEERLRDLQDPRKVIAASSEALGLHLGAREVVYAEIDGSGDHAIVEHGWNDGTKSNAGIHKLEAFGKSFIHDLEQGHAVAIPDVTRDPRTSAPTALEAFANASVAAFVNIPLIKSGRLVAVLAVHQETPRIWSVEEVALTEEVAQRNWAAVERARAEQHLRDSQAQFRSLVEAIPHLVWTAGPRGEWEYASPQWQAYTGQSMQEAKELGWLEVVHLDDRERTIQAWDAADRFGLVDVEHRLRRHDGSFRWFRTTAAPLSAENGGTRWFGTCSDFEDQVAARDVLARSREDLEHEVLARTEELEQAHSALRQSQKLEAMGQLTGGVAHDFNNLLTPIVGSLDMLQRRALGGERERRMIDGAIQAAERAKVLVQRLLAFARRQPLKVEPVDLAGLVDGMADLVASTTGPQIKVVVETTEGLPAALTDRNQLEMALLNLSVNARDAMPDGGTLRITTGSEGIGRGHRSGLPPGTYIRLSVADTGVGMDEETLARAIEPFFSTKGVGKGTGLGLSMVHGLASQLGGALAIASRRGLGTNVDLWLRVAEMQPAPDEKGDQPATRGEGIGTALLVDDEALVRASTAEMLADLGYSVVEAASAEEALRLMRNGVRPDVLVTDHLMPGMSGTDLARHARDARRDLPVLIVSGYADLDGIAPDLPRLIKPFRSNELAVALQGLA